MKRYTLKFLNGDNIENIWSGNEMSEALKREDMAAKQYGRDNVWVCDNMQELTVG